MLKGCGPQECLGSQKHHPCHRDMPGPSTSLPRDLSTAGVSSGSCFVSRSSSAFKHVRWGSCRVEVLTVRAGPGSRVERRRPVAFASLEVSGDVHKRDKDTGCISRRTLGNAAVTNIPRIHGLMPQSCISCSRLVQVMSQVCSACFLSRGIQAKDADLLWSFSEPKERECGEPHSALKVSASMRHAPSAMSVWKSLI